MQKVQGLRLVSESFQPQPSLTAKLTPILATGNYWGSNICGQPSTLALGFQLSGQSRWPVITMVQPKAAID